MNGRRRLSVCPSVQSAVLMLYQTSHVEAEGTILYRNVTEHLCMSLSQSVSPPVCLSVCWLFIFLQKSKIYFINNQVCNTVYRTPGQWDRFCSGWIKFSFKPQPLGAKRWMCSISFFVFFLRWQQKGYWPRAPKSKLMLAPRSGPFARHRVDSQMILKRFKKSWKDSKNLHKIKKILWGSLQHFFNELRKA